MSYVVKDGSLYVYHWLGPKGHGWAFSTHQSAAHRFRTAYQARQRICSSRERVVRLKKRRWAP